MIIVGAGCAGLACARVLADEGAQPLVLDKARGVGGRAATRRVDGQPIDHGVVFYHGSDPVFLEALDRVETSARIDGWPEVVVGDGQPCLPRAFEPAESRVAFPEGITAFPKSLARGLDVRLQTRVDSLVLGDGKFELGIDGNASLETETLALALPAEQMRSLIASLPTGRELESVRALLETLTTVPCLTVIAGYPLDAPVPEWDVSYPSRSDVVMLASHDSRKRREKKFHAFALQCSPKFSRRHLDDEPDTWVASVFDEAGSLFGDWARSPSFTQSQRWRFGRPNSLPLSRPIVVEFPGGARLGLAGELFHPSLGVEAAYLSGLALAKRFAERDGPRL